MKFGENLYTLRKNMQITQEQLSELVDVSRQSVSKWELGESYPTVENIFKLCNVLKCKMNELINEKLTDFELLSDDVKNIEKYDQERFKKFLLSQSSMQHAIKYNYDKIIEDLNVLDEKLYKAFKGKTLDAMYSYKMRIGIK